LRIAYFMQARHTKSPNYYIPCVSLPRQFGGLAPRQARQGLTFQKIRCVALSHQAALLLVAPRHEAAEIAAARTFNLGPEQRSWLIVRNGGKSVI